MRFNISLNLLQYTTSVYEKVNENMICGDLDHIARGKSTIIAILKQMLNEYSLSHH